MEGNFLQETEKERLPSVITEEVHALNKKVVELEEEVSELKKDIHAIDLLQKKPIVSSDAIAIGGFWIVAALVIIGVFYV